MDKTEDFYLNIRYIQSVCISSKFKYLMLQFHKYLVWLRSHTLLKHWYVISSAVSYTDVVFIV